MTSLSRVYDHRPLFATSPLSSRHNRQTFFCGNNALDAFFQRQANQDHKRRLAAFLCLSLQMHIRNPWFYTLFASVIEPSHLP